MAGHRRKKGHDDHEEHMDEAWLVSYADMMTLLVALFMVLFSISSVNISKFESLQRSLQAAFSGKIFPGGQALKESGGDDTVPKSSSSSSLVPSLVPSTPPKGDAAKKRELEQLRQVQQKVDKAVKQLGLQNRVQTRITPEGLRLKLLTDDLLFDSGQALPNAASFPLLARLGKILDDERQHTIHVEGHTDPVPTAGTQFPTNWELSTARATSVVRAFTAAGVDQKRMTASGRAYLDPATSNATAAGRSLNRRVEILLPRLAR